MSKELPCRRVARWGVACLVIGVLVVPAFGMVYEVGPGKAYATIGSIPAAANNTLAAGDTINIYPKAANAPYYEKIALTNNGTSVSPITFQGVPDAQGNLPILDGTNAVQVGYSVNLDRGLIQTGSGSSGTGNYIVIQNLELRNAYYGTTYYRGSTAYTYGTNAAGVFVQNGANVIIRNCWSHGNSNGIQTGGKSLGCTNLLIESCRVELNGRVGSSQEHNFYVGAEPVTVQYCYIGGLRAGADGQNYKDRSSGTIFRYNWVEGGPNDQLDLVDGGTQPANAYVYGNVIVKTNETGNGRMCLFGGDSGGSRAGTLYFMNNTFITTRSSALTTVFQLSPAGNTVQAYNNIIYCPWGGSNLALQNGSTANYSYDWISPGYSTGGATVSSAISPAGNNPYFVNYAAKDYHLAASSACINAGATTWPGQANCTAVRQYVVERQSEARPVDSHIDIGAYEYVLPPPHVIAVSPALGHVSYKDAPLTAISITFDKDVTISAGMVSVSGANTGVNSGYTFSYNSPLHVVTLQWPTGLANDTYLVTVSDAVTAGGVALDGEIDKLNPVLPSGNGAAGGSFSCLVYRLAADMNEDRSVDVVDLLTLVETFGLVSGDPGFDATCDLNDDGGVDVLDLLDLVYNFGETIPQE
jgi:hypothetical protein